MQVGSKGDRNSDEGEAQQWLLIMQIFIEEGIVQQEILPSGGPLLFSAGVPTVWVLLQH